MELVDRRFAEFRHGDLVLFVRTRASVADKLAMERATGEDIAALRAGGKPKLGREAMRIFIEGWSGVTAGGKPAPYSFELFESGLPAAMVDEMFPALCQFLLEHVDILKHGK